MIGKRLLLILLGASLGTSGCLVQTDNSVSGDARPPGAALGSTGDPNLDAVLQIMKVNWRILP